MLESCKAQLVEGRGDHESAAEVYLEAASGWEHHGTVPEQAYALLGQGRCLVALEDPAAEEPLRQAAELFSSMGYRPALADTEALIAQTTATLHQLGKDGEAQAELRQIEARVVELLPVGSTADYGSEAA